MLFCLPSLPFSTPSLVSCPLSPPPALRGSLRASPAPSSLTRVARPPSSLASLRHPPPLVARPLHRSLASLRRPASLVARPLSSLAYLLYLPSSPASPHRPPPHRSPTFFTRLPSSSRLPSRRPLIARLPSLLASLRRPLPFVARPLHRSPTVLYSPPFSPGPLPSCIARLPSSPRPFLAALPASLRRPPPSSLASIRHLFHFAPCAARLSTCSPPFAPFSLCHPPSVGSRLHMSSFVVRLSLLPPPLRCPLPSSPASLCPPFVAASLRFPPPFVGASFRYPPPYVLPASPSPFASHLQCPPFVAPPPPSARALCVARHPSSPAPRHLPSFSSPPASLHRTTPPPPLFPPVTTSLPSSPAPPSPPPGPSRLVGLNFGKPDAQKPDKSRPRKRADPGARPVSSRRVLSNRKMGAASGRAKSRLPEPSAPNENSCSKWRS
ncbi:hypothetical protein C7M84_023956 [Penaeus vannamei]|uniref:Uncharacterized protein n=1 Tax=Penaeus vannamei TaxID=6689 RepID=A0A3R7QLM8_PENVA|nr:hypothetical protein C7M84_023956 [Penaeus vannamei]